MLQCALQLQSVKRTTIHNRIEYLHDFRTENRFIRVYRQGNVQLSFTVCKYIGTIIGCTRMNKFKFELENYSPCCCWYYFALAFCVLQRYVDAGILLGFANWRFCSVTWCYTCFFRRLFFVFISLRCF